MARDLCPANGDAWKYSYCSAKASGDEKKARIYRDRAVFNGVSQVECAPEAVRQPEPLPGFVRRKYALLVGIGKFADPSIPTLRFAAKDARDLREVLIDPRSGNFADGDVFLLTDETATRANILKALNQIALQAGEEDLVLLFFSSHGSPRRDGQGLQGIGYIVTHDSTQKEIYLNSIEFEDLSQKVSLIAARRKVTLLDTCYSGQAPRGGKALVLEGAGVGVPTANLFLSGEGSYVITSSQENEVSYESERLQNGYFTHFLVEALRQGPEPPTIQQVFRHLSTKVKDVVASERQASQRPRLFPEDGRGEVRIGVVATRD